MTQNDIFHPPEAVQAKAHISSMDTYRTEYAKSLSDPDAFWADHANQLHWETKWSSPVCSYNFDVNKGPVFIKWFEGATTNICYNALDRHVAAGHGDRTAILWEGNDLNQQLSVSYKQMLDKVCQAANYLKSIGVKKGDDVTIYMPMVVELPVIMLACARIGAVHSVVFGGFSAQSLADRVLDSQPRVVITTNNTKRGPKPIELKAIVDEALKIVKTGGHEVSHVVVTKNMFDDGFGKTTSMESGRDVWWHEAVDAQPSTCEVEWMGAEEPLFKLYTSGSTGKPKAVLHSTGGYMVGAATTFKYVFDYQPEDVFFCTADCGWITGHSYVTYGPLINCATQVLFEGVPTYPDPGRCWDIIDKYNVTAFYTAPTAIRALQAKGDAFVTRHSRKSLRLLGTVGEPINPEAWRWYHEVVGDCRCPIVDTWWQTETGAHMLSPLPGATPLKPGSATLPFFGVEPAIVDDQGNELQGECEGMLVMKRPWPSMMRTVAGNHERFEQTYFSMFKGMYFTGDSCKRDADGYYWIIGRVDDVMNVSGHRIGSAEVESALVEHTSCVEAAVVPIDHSIKGQAIYAYVTLMEGIDYPPPENVRAELISTVRSIIGPIATPDVIQWAPGLPKTRSGKIMRRILRKIASHEEAQLGDTSTLADPSVVQSLIQWRDHEVDRAAAAKAAK